MGPFATIQGLWIGEQLSIMEQLSISSFLQNGHSFDLYTYDEVKGVPEGVVLKDAHQIIPSSQIFKYKDYDSYAGFSNLFRYRLLVEKGGYWVDMDVICLKPFQFEPDHVFASELAPYSAPAFWKESCNIANCVIKAPLGSEIMKYCYHESAKRDPLKLKWSETGPALMTAAVQKFELQGCMTPPHTFCPVHWWQWRQLIIASATDTSEKIQAPTSESPSAVHLWNEMWRRNGINKNVPFSQNSLYERLKHRYLN